MKPNDKAYEAARSAILKAIAERNCMIACVPFNENNTDEFDAGEAVEHAKVAVDAAYAAQFPPSEDHKPLKKAWLCYRLCEGGGAYDGPFFIKYDPYEENDYDKIEPILYYDAAQFQSEDYAGLVKWLRDKAESLSEIYPPEAEAADALEAALAERDTYKNWLDNYEKQFAAKVEELVTIRLERDALLARLAPVDDKALVEIVAKRLNVITADDDYDEELKWNNANIIEKEYYLIQARVAIAAVRPHIEAAERERCAAALEITSDEIRLHAGEMTAQEMRSVLAVLAWRAAAIRRGK